MKWERGHLLSKSIFIRAFSSPVVTAAPTLDQPSFISWPFRLHIHPGMSKTRLKLPSL